MFGMRMAEMMAQMSSGGGIEGGPRGRRRVLDVQTELTEFQRTEVERIRAEKAEDRAKAEENIGLLISISYAVSGYPASTLITPQQELIEYGDRTNNMMPCVSFVLDHIGQGPDTVQVSGILMSKMQDKALDEIAYNLEENSRSVVRFEKLSTLIEIDDDGDVFHQNEMIRPHPRAMSDDGDQDVEWQPRALFDEGSGKPKKARKPSNH